MLRMRLEVAKSLDKWCGKRDSNSYSYCYSELTSKDNAAANYAIPAYESSLSSYSGLIGGFIMVVLRARFELAIHFWRWIFLLLHVAMTAFALQSGVHLDHITIVTQVRAVYSLHIPSFDVSSAIVSKRFPPNLTRFTLVISFQVLKPRFIEAKVHIVSQFQHRSIEIEYLTFNHSLDLRLTLIYSLLYSVTRQ